MTKRGREHEDKTIDRHYRDPEKRKKAKKTFLYQAAGIRERHGYTPWWLQIVFIGLIIWAVVYLVIYWSPPE